MDSRSLLLLGMLKAQSRHGYQINEFIEHNLRDLIPMKKSTAYTILDRLGEAGLVSMVVDQEGNRPPRKVYSITEEGERQFRQLLKDNLEMLDLKHFEEDVGILLMDELPIAEAMAALREKLRRIELEVNKYEKVPHHEVRPGVDMAIDHHLSLLKAERDWVLRLMGNLRTKTQV